MFEKKELEEEMKKIERKKDVHFMEKQKAHVNALNFREQQQVEKKYEDQINKMNKPAVQDLKNIDYTQTRFHVVQTVLPPTIETKNVKLTQL
jgi:hypothetical protein